MNVLLQALDADAPLLSVHRLDACTEGLVVLGRSAAFVSAFNKLQLEGSVQKYYRALTLRPPPIGPSCCHTSSDIQPG